MASLVDQTKTINLHFLADTPRLRNEKPYRIRGFVIEPEDGVELTNMEWQNHEVTVIDVRKTTEVPDFAQCGFKWVDYKTEAVPSYTEGAMVTFCDEMIALLHSHVEAEKVLCYDMRVSPQSSPLSRRWTSNSSA